MAWRGKLELKGSDELVKQLKTLKVEVQRKILRVALKAGAKPIHSATVALAPEKQGEYSGKMAKDRSPGMVRRSIKVRARSRKGKPLVMIQTKAGDFKGKAFYAAFSEFGTKDRHQKDRATRIAGAAYITKTGKKRNRRSKAGKGRFTGKVTKTEFMRRGFEQGKESAEQIIEQQVQAGIDKVLAS